MVIDVAPFAGAWIEIKFCYSICFLETVAPFAGAWIEIYTIIGKYAKTLVAPFAGAWIEIIPLPFLLASLLRRTLRGCVD